MRMADQKSAFPTMGTSAAQVTPVAPDPDHTTVVAKPGSGKNDGPDDAGSATHRSVSMERNGFKGAPQTTLYAQNAAEASATYRNVRLLPSAKGNSDFYYKRQYGQSPDFG